MAKINLFKGMKIPRIRVVDIGAMAEGAPRHAPLILKGLAEVVAFEPNEEERKKLSAIPHQVTLPHFIGDGTERTFHLTQFPGCSSLYEPDPAYIDPFDTMTVNHPTGNYRVMERSTVQTTRLDDIPECRPCHFLKMDIQGAELDALQGGREMLKDVLIIESEVEFVPLYKNQALYGDISGFLLEQGFMLHKFIDMAGRPFRPFRNVQNPKAPLSQVLWADAIFVPTFERLDALASDKLLRLAFILAEIYASYDLAGLCLSRYDGKKGTKYFDQFTKALQAGGGGPPFLLNIRTH